MDEQNGKIVRFLRAEFANRSDLASCYLSGPPHGGLAVRAPAFVREGELAVVNAEIVSEKIKEELLGVILWVRDGRSDHVTAGVGFFESEIERRERLLAPRAPIFDKERREIRIEAALPVTMQTAGSFFVCRTRDVSRSGIGFQSASLPDASEGEEIDFSIFGSPSDEPIDLSGQIAWSKPGVGFGTRLKGTLDEERAKLERLLGELAANLDLPDGGK
jgi:Tfp pilus assembly protein PilZ